MSVSTQVDVLDELCSRVGNINLESSKENISTEESIGNESVKESASVQFARLQQVSTSTEGSPVVPLPVYITPCTFPGEEGELLLIPARRISGHCEELQEGNKPEKRNVLEAEPELENDCSAILKIMDQSPLLNSEIYTSVINKLDDDDDNIVQNILNSSFTEVIENEAEEKQTHLKPDEELNKLLATETVLDSMCMESDLQRGIDDQSLERLEKETLFLKDATSDVNEGKVNMSHTAPEVETELNASFIECRSSEKTDMETILNTSFIEDEDFAQRDKDEMVTFPKLASENYGLTNGNVVGPEEIIESDKNVAVADGLQGVVNTSFTEESIIAVRMLEENNTAKTIYVEQELKTSYIEYSVIGDEQESENMTSPKNESIGSCKNVKKEINESENKMFAEKLTYVAGLSSSEECPKGKVEGNISFMKTSTESNFNVPFVELPPSINVSSSSRDSNKNRSQEDNDQQEAPFESSFNQTFIENAVMEVEENTSLIETAQNYQTSSRVDLNVTITEESQENKLEPEMNTTMDVISQITEIKSTLCFTEPVLISKSVENTGPNTIERIFQDTFDDPKQLQSEINMFSHASISSVVTSVEQLTSDTNNVRRATFTKRSAAERIVDSQMISSDDSVCQDEVLRETRTTSTDPNYIFLTSSEQLLIDSSSETVQNAISPEYATTNEIVPDATISSNILVNECDELSVEASMSKTNLNSTFVASGAQSLNVSHTETVQNAFSPEYATTKETVTDGRVSSDTLVSKCDELMNTSITKTDLNSTFVASGVRSLNVSNTETVQNIISTESAITNKIVADTESSSGILISECDELSVEASMSKSDLNSTFVASGAQSLNLSHTETIKNAFSPEYATTKVTDASVSSDTLVYECHELMDTNITKTDLNSTFVASGVRSLNVSDTQTVQNIISAECATTNDIVTDAATLSDILVSECDELSVEVSVTKTDLNSTFVAAGVQSFNVPDTENVQNAISPEYATRIETVTDARISSDTLVNKCDELMGTSITKTDLNSPFMASGVQSLNVSDTETVQNIISTEYSTTNEIVADAAISSDILVNACDELSVEATVTKTDLNSTFVTSGVQSLNMSDSETVQKATSPEFATTKEAVRDARISSHTLVNECDELVETNVTKTDLNSTFVASGVQSLNVSDTETFQNPISPEYANTMEIVTDARISSDNFVNECDELMDTSITKTDLNSTFVASGVLSLNISDTETVQNATSPEFATTKEAVTDARISSHTLVNECDELVESNVTKTDLNSTFVASGVQSLNVSDTETFQNPISPEYANTMEIVTDARISSDNLVNECDELMDTSITKTDLNSTFVASGVQSLNVSDTETFQNPISPEYANTMETVTDARISSDILVNECDKLVETSITKTDLNSTFVTSGVQSLNVSDTETVQNAISTEYATRKESVTDAGISSNIVVNEGDELSVGASMTKTDLNSTFIASCGKPLNGLDIETLQNSTFSEYSARKGPVDGEISSDVIAIQGDKLCKETSVRGPDLNFTFVQDALTEMKKMPPIVLENKIPANITHHVDNILQKNHTVNDTDVSSCMNVFVSQVHKTNSITSFPEVSLSTDNVSIVEELNILSCKTFNQIDTAENIRDHQEHALIEFEAVPNNMSLMRSDRNDPISFAKSAKNFESESEEVNGLNSKHEANIQESEFLHIQKNVEKNTSVPKANECMVMEAPANCIPGNTNIKENGKNIQGQEDCTGLPGPLQNVHEKVVSNSKNMDIKKSFSGITPSIEAFSFQKSMAEESSKAAFNLLDCTADDFLSNDGNGQPQDLNFVLNDEVFKDPRTFDFLTQFGNSQSLHDLRKESLYIKFDPLLGSPRSITVTDKQLSALNIVREAEKDECKKINSTVEANGEGVEIQNETCEKESVRSVECFLRSKSPLLLDNDSKKDLIVEKYEEELNTLKAQITELQEIIKTKDEVHKNEVAKYSSQIVAQDFDLAMQREEIDKLLKELEKNKGENQALDAVMVEYERAVSQLVAEKEQNVIMFGEKELQLTRELQECQKIIADKDQELSEVQGKYERLKNNAKKLSETNKDIVDKIKTYEKIMDKEKEKYLKLKNHAAEQLESANDKLMAEDKRHKLECAKYSSMIAKLDLQVKSLQEQIDQKTEENKHLMAMCTELVEQFEH